MAKHTLTIDIDPPAGWEYAGDVRNAQDGDTWLGSDGRALLGPMAWPVPILRRKRWRADLHGQYWSVWAEGAFSCCDWGTDNQMCNRLYACGNYWRTEAEAARYADACHELALKMHAENAETQEG
jgi:hypothetical protein